MHPPDTFGDHEHRSAPGMNMAHDPDWQDLKAELQRLRRRVAELEAAAREGWAIASPSPGPDPGVRRHLREIEVLAGMARSLTMTLDPETGAREILNWMQLLIPGAVGFLCSLPADTGSRTLMASTGLEIDDTAHVPWSASGGAGNVAKDARAVSLTPDIRTDPQFAQQTWAHAGGLVSAATLPLVHGERVYGQLCVLTREQHDFSPAEVQILESFAAQAGAALANSSAYRESIRRSDRLQRLSRLTARMVSSLELEDVLQVIVEDTAKLLDQEGAGLRLVEGDCLVLVSQYGISKQIMVKHSIALDESLSGRVAKENRPIAVDNLDDNRDVTPQHKKAILAQGANAWIGAPVRYRGRLVGVLQSVGRRKRSYTEEDISLLSVFADHAAIAIENGRLYRELLRKSEGLEALHRITAGVASSLALEHTLQSIVEEAPKLLDLDGAGLRLYQGDRLVMVRQHGLTGGPRIKESIETGESLSGRVALENRPIIVKDIETDEHVDPQHKAALLAAGARSWIGVPARHHDRVVGVLVSVSNRRREFSAEDIALLTAFADHAAIAAENSRLYTSAQNELVERRRVEAALRDHQDRLEEIVDERTAMLREAQAALLRKERLAALGQLTGSVSHELRTPLGTIHSSLDLIQRLLPQPEGGVQRALERAVRNVQRCNGIISELLDFARSRALEPARVALGPWLSDLLREHEVPRTVSVRFDLDPKVEADVDEELLRRAVINVIDNAVQAMAGDRQGEPAPGARLSVRCRARGERAVIEVEDNGPGMEPEVLDKVLEPLFSTRVTGIGLGLPIVSRILEQHGGGVDFDSRPGQGTRVSLWLPWSQEPPTTGHRVAPGP